MDKPLVIYKASAGSGKTFTLAIEYIKLLIKNPQNFRSILAVTFTNKATEEMKFRILSQLYGIWKNLDDSQSYIAAICTGLGVSEDYVRKQAETALKLIIHNYNYFRIETIDSFFQGILRNLSRELDLTANLHIELNDAQIEEMAVDELIDNLKVRDEFLSWIISYIKDNISEDKGWNVIGAIKTFGKTIFKDFYKDASKKLTELIGKKSFFDNYKAIMYAEKKTATVKMQNYADDFFYILDTNGLSVCDFANKEKGVCGFFIKLRAGVFDENIVGKRTLECMEQPEKWASKSCNVREQILSLASSQLIDLLRRAVDDRAVQWKKYKSAELTLRHLNQLRLLNSIEKKVHEMNEAANRFLLSDTQYLLKLLISDSDSPFIYEKIGTQIKFIMIDEFQDTSTTQWQNFKVLLSDCISQSGSRNIIVGDVKQSIYRWRDSDWKLLNGIETQFPNYRQVMDIRTLDTNYRSCRNIIEFNNAFFSTAVELECASQTGTKREIGQQLRNAYHDVKQSVPYGKQKEGFVSIELLSNIDYERLTLQTLADKVAILLEKGIALNKISILVRSNNHIPLIAGYFMDNMPKVRVVSDEAFRLDASTAVQIIIHALHLLTHDKDLISKAFLVKAYQNVVLGNNISENELFLSDNWNDLLPPIYMMEVENLRRTPLYDLAEQLYYIFELKKLSGQSSYVCAFFDLLSDFTEEFSSDIDTFINKWNETFCSTTIQCNDIDGIRLISIHKSKGLEFDNVIIPFCDWQIEKNNGNIIWCKPKCAPYNALPLVPVDYNNSLMGTIYEDEYVEERVQNCVDNLNLLYVAFTRACNNLFIIGKKDATNSRSTLIQSCLPDVAATLDGCKLKVPDNDAECIEFRYGKLTNSKSTSNLHTDNLFLRQSDIEELNVETFINHTEFKQSNKSQEFITKTGKEEDVGKFIKTGTMLHKVFSTIETYNDVDRVLIQLQNDGILSWDSTENEQIIQVLRHSFTDPRVKDWFSGKWKLFNECSILDLDPNGHIVVKRPDRVMTDGRQILVVDFKFGIPNKEHILQVRQYMKLLNSMGYNKVKGYLWYVYSNMIEEV